MSYSLRPSVPVVKRRAEQADRARERIKAAREATRAERLAIQAESIDDAAAPEFADYIRSTSTDTNLDELEKRLAEYASRIGGEQDRRYVVEQIAEMLRELGVVVPDGFASMALDEDSVAVPLPMQDGYALEITIKRGEVKMRAEAVTLTGDVSNQIEAETAGRELVDALVGALLGVGIDVSIESREPVGSHVMRRAGSPSEGHGHDHDATHGGHGHTTTAQAGGGA